MNFGPDDKAESIFAIILLIFLIRLGCKEIYKIRWNAYNDKAVEEYNKDWAKKEDIPKEPNDFSKLLISVAGIFVISMSNVFFISILTSIIFDITIVGVIVCKLRYKRLQKEYEEKWNRVEELKEEYTKKKKAEKFIVYGHQDIEFTGATMGVCRSYGGGNRYFSNYDGDANHLHFFLTKVIIYDNFGI